ncbi:hypothetical protein WME94_06070 [Sorangium sp. So ce429]
MVRYYQGPIRPPAEAAVVTIAPQVFVSALDGRWLGKDTFIEMLPGTHKLRIALFDRMGMLRYRQGSTRRRCRSSLVVNIGWGSINWGKGLPPVLPGRERFSPAAGSGRD